MQNSFLKKIFLVLFGIILMPSFSDAQNTKIPEITEQIYINVSPKFPKPEQKVEVTLEAYGTDLNRANITWRVNGTTALTGIGEKSFEIMSGKSGEAKKISISIKPINGPEIIKNLTIAPQEVDLIWEANTYKPPFYKGKSLPSFESEVTILAIPNFYSATNGAYINPNTLVYNWKNNNKADQKYSGYAKNFMKFTNSILLRDAEISLEVYGSGEEKSQKYLELPQYNTQIFLYEKHPTLGILFNKMLRDGDVIEEEEKTYEAYPFSFSGSSRWSSDFSFLWKLNGKKVQIGEAERSLTFRNVDGSSGKATIGVLVKHAKKFLQEKEITKEINYSVPERVFGF